MTLNPKQCSFFILVAAVRAAGQLASPLACPVRNCQKKTTRFQAAESTEHEAWESQTPCDEELSSYTVNYGPGHFTCMQCDVSACPDCSILCDLSSCVGSFYTQECWCQTGDQNSDPAVVFCDEDCGGGVCDTPGFQCGSRYEACQPWWWCGAPPPTSFLQRRTGHQRSGATATQRSSSAAARSLSQRLEAWRSQAQLASSALKAPEKLHLQAGRFECETAGLPPKTRDPKTMVWVERGYLVLDRETCQGSTFEHDCFCWDNFRRLRGEDPLTSEFKCDSKCKWGGCEGRTCAKEVPKAVKKPVLAQPMSTQTRMEWRMPVVMEAVDSPGFKPGPQPLR